MPNCIFCNIIKKEISDVPIFEDTTTIVHLDIHPSAPGHALVIPKKHGLSILDYTMEELGLLMSTVQKTAEALERALRCEAITIGINHKEKKGLPHLHIHLIPRWENDNGTAIQGVVANPPHESNEDLAKKIREVW